MTYQKVKNTSHPSTTRDPPHTLVEILLKSWRVCIFGKGFLTNATPLTLWCRDPSEVMECLHFWRWDV